MIFFFFQNTLFCKDGKYKLASMGIGLLINILFSDKNQTYRVEFVLKWYRVYFYVFLGREITIAVILI